MTNSYPIRAFIRKYLSTLFPFLRTKFGFLRCLRYKGREDYLLGHLKGNISIEQAKVFLENSWFHSYSVAWIDIGEILWMRKNDGFEYQYHIRVFDDGEVRWHYELTPEYARFRHFFDFDKSEKKTEFWEMIGDILK